MRSAIEVIKRLAIADGKTHVTSEELGYCIAKMSKVVVHASELMLWYASLSEEELDRRDPQELGFCVELRMAIKAMEQ